MNKRASGPPRRPRNPVAKAVRTPAFRQRVVPDKRRESQLKDVEKSQAEKDKDEDQNGDA